MRILREPRNALLKQYRALLGTEGMEVSFADDAIDELAGIADRVNQQTENIGARRLYTVLERLLDDLSFRASELDDSKITIDREYVTERLEGIVSSEDITRYIL